RAVTIDHGGCAPARSEHSVIATFGMTFLFLPAGPDKIKGIKMTDTGSHADTRDMYMVHTTFRREFGALPALVRNVRPGS
ncbi:MAG: hypothetical protein JWL68_5952, partial [Actinomycetia bacterium]|nr:hypothetical protein [Actinomycetes bacterium]